MSAIRFPLYLRVSEGDISFEYKLSLASNAQSFLGFQFNRHGPSRYSE